MVDLYSTGSHRIVYILPGSSVCDDPVKYKNLITNCVINRLMSILFSFKSRNSIKLNKSIH